MIRTLRWISRKRIVPPHGFKFTRGGSLFLVGVVLIGLAAIDSDINLLMMVFGLCCAALLLNMIAGWRTLRGLRVRRLVPDVLVAGQVFEIRYQVTNPRRWGTARAVRLIDLLPRKGPMPGLECFIASIRPAESVTVSVPTCCRIRGRLEFSRIRLASHFPFGVFVKYTTIFEEHEAVVFPALGRLRRDVKAGARTSDASGAGGASNHARGDEEFYGIREYRLGDNPRRIHWRRSARTRQLMVREMTQAREHQMWCVVHTRVTPDDPLQAAKLEEAISCAATVVCDLLERGAKVGLVCSGEPLVVLPPGGGRSHRPRLLRELALRTVHRQEALAEQLHQVSWPQRWRGPVMFFAAAEYPEWRTDVHALTRSIGPTSVYVPDHAAFEGLFISPTTPTMPGGELLRRRPARMRRSLRATR